MKIDTVKLSAPKRDVPQIFLKVKGILLGNDPPMPPIPKGCESSLGISVKQKWAERGTLTTAAGISVRSSKLTNQEGNFLYDNSSTEAFISIYPPKNYCVVTLELDLGIKIWQNNMESCGASENNQEPFMVQELGKYSSCYKYKNGICQCWPAYTTPKLEFELCALRFLPIDPLKYCMKSDEKDPPTKCELCIMGTRLYPGGSGSEDFP
jgi:hypothetical protein